MNGFIFDYGGTLDTLKNPVQYIKDIKKKYTDYEIVLYSGTEVDEVEATHPGLIREIRLFVPKPDLIVPALKNAGITFKKVIFVDNDPIMRKVMEKLFKGGCTTYSPERMMELV